MLKKSLEYNKVLLDHYQNPRNFGKIVKATHQSEQPNPACGDVIVVYLKINGEKIEAIKYEAKGCALMIASASVLSEKIMNNGLKIKECEKLNIADIEKLLGTKIPPTRQLCVELPIQAIKKSLKYKK